MCLYFLDLCWRDFHRTDWFRRLDGLVNFGELQLPNLSRNNPFFSSIRVEVVTELAVLDSGSPLKKILLGISTWCWSLRC